MDSEDERQFNKADNGDMPSTVSAGRLSAAAIVINYKVNARGYVHEVTLLLTSTEVVLGNASKNPYHLCCTFFDYIDVFETSGLTQNFLVTASDEIHLFDLASIQLELERILANVIERLQCLTAESKGEDVPSLVLTSFQQRQRQATTCDSDANQALSNGRPALMVKANPNKPLTLIISQRNRLSQLHQPVHNSEATGSSRAKPFPTLICGRRISRSSTEEPGEQNPSASPDKNQAASRQVIFVFIQATIAWLFVCCFSFLLGG
ncbi:uncharacterized protein DEA37_0015161 [Paragonimus westermani]|uniref:Uncharacterized protein n=1 Tax=Paragonimus westermani TaxID=34504 RepID=A0A5J4N900_9TREM|nr:uncharacterized protein DEA37_0015161 [Paragonimus westermani]